ncbi:Hypothetical protein PHPALM_13143 [Phytophthora palmivora]|uniref:Uncharacterized protein n=1 Tax=Phytophthora palmivora TaxID=4796 RepID=A0A2P4XXX6_9STRA|nr:Hypothetical protein PHPALM_13143 [Phytophthora palmivora]
MSLTPERLFPFGVCIERARLRLVVPMDDPARNMFTPMYSALRKTKTEHMYDDILHLIHRDTGFWHYFRKRLERYLITEWDVIGIANTLVARTNNPRECFNRETNAAFKSLLTGEEWLQN